jgi:predicted dehydrogenase
MISFAIVGAGWRSEFYLRLGLLMPEQLELIGTVVRDSTRARRIESDYGVKTFETLSELIKFRQPNFVVVAVSWESNPEIVKELVAIGIPVLCETPPASTVTELRNLWASVGSADLVHVAEQYMFLPGHAARLNAINSDVIGSPTSVEISSTHGYHAVALMRGFLNSGFEETTVRTSSLSAPLIDPLSREGWNEDLTPQLSNTTISIIDFGNHKSGIYNFVDNQWHNQLRHRRIVIRGSAGEIVDDRVIALAEGPHLVRSDFRRYQLGHDLNLDGFDTEHISLNGKVLYLNPFLGLRLMDEEIAIATALTKMAKWVAGQGEGPYPLREACQDQLIALAIEESLKIGKAIQTSLESWAN